MLLVKAGMLVAKQLRFKVQIPMICLYTTALLLAVVFPTGEVSNPGEGSENVFRREFGD